MKLKELEKRLRQEPDNLGLRVQVAGLMREAGRSLEAVELYRSVALAYRDQGRTNQAIAVCRSILEIAPEDAACQGLLAMLQGRSNPTPSRPPPVAEAPPQIVPATPVKITEPVSIPSVPALRQTTKQPVQDADDDVKPAAVVEQPPRRSSFDDTPLPRPIPYHVSDPTSQPHKVSARELEENASKSYPPRTGGLAEAARRISGLISNTDSRPGIPNREMDMSAELDTRQRPKVKSEQLRKLTPFDPPSDVRDPSPLDADDRTAPRETPLEEPTRNPAHDEDEFLATERVDGLTPPPRGSDERITPRPGDYGDDRYTPRPGDDLYTPPPRGSDDALTPPPLAGVPPPLEPPRSTALPSRPPKAISIPPMTATSSGKTPSCPPLGTEPPIRRALPHVPKSRDSDDELTKPHDRLPPSDDDDE